MELFIKKASQLTTEDLFTLGLKLFNDPDCANEALSHVLDLLAIRDENLLVQFDEATS